MVFRNGTFSAWIVASLCGCSGQSFEFAASSLSSEEPASSIREPLGNGEEFPMKCYENTRPGPMEYGIHATAYHSATGVDSSLEAINVGTRIQRPYVLDALLVPSRDSDMGFPIPSGLLRKDDGEILRTYYALDLYSSLSLGADDEEGYYQFAVLSDDGTTLHFMDETGRFVSVLADEGEHAPRVACSSKAIYMKKGASVTFRLTYFQGPATKIALTVIWRRWNSADPNGETSRCNTSPEIFEAGGKTLVKELRDAGWKAPSSLNYVASGSSEICYYDPH